MQYEMVPRHELVFDYDTEGDLFYMVLEGRISCKIPVYKQLIHMSPDEMGLYTQILGKDLINVQEAYQVNNMVRRKQPLDLKKGSVLQNPFGDSA